MSIPYRILPESIVGKIKNRDWNSLRAVNWPEFDLCSSELADSFETLDQDGQAAFFEVVPEMLAAAVLSRLSPHVRLPFFASLDDSSQSSLLRHMHPDDRFEFIQEISDAEGRDVIALLPPIERKEAENLLQFPPNSAGRMMTPDFMIIREDWSIQDVLNHLRQNGEDRETLSTLYVCDKRGVLLDALSLNRIVLTDPKASVRDIMDYTVLAIHPREDRELAVELMQKYDRLALPLVDELHRIIGIVTIDDIMDIARDEVTEDFHLQAGVKPLSQGYWDVRIGALLKSRLPWLAVLIAVNLLSSGIISSYEETLTLYVGLAFFIPLLIDAGGNSGSQAAMMMIRALSTGDIRADQWKRILLRELLCGVLIGIVLGLMGGTLGFLRGGPDLALVLFVSLLLILIVTNLTGVLLPFALSALKLDPAMASGPLITTVADAAGLLIYFRTASFFLGI